MTLLMAGRAGQALGERAGLDEGAFQRLYRDQLGPVLNYARYRLGGAEAEDAAADVFMRAWAARASYEAGLAAPRAWLWGIARNAVTDRLRYRRPEPLEIPAEVPAGPEPGAELDRHEEWRRLRAAMLLLAELDQEIIALRFGGGQTNRAIAGITGLSEANVAQRLRRALRRMRLEMEGAVAP